MQLGKISLDTPLIALGRYFSPLETDLRGVGGVLFGDFAPAHTFRDLSDRGPTSVLSEATIRRHQIRVDDEKIAGRPVFAGLSHPGMMRTTEQGILMPTVSQISLPLQDKLSARRISTSECEVLANTFGYAAQAAVKSGYRGICLDARRFSLLGMFMRQGMNRRKDKYGQTVAGRIRLVCESIGKIQESGIGALILALSFEEDGRSPAEILLQLRFFEQAGADAIFVNGDLPTYVRDYLRSQSHLKILMAEEGITRSLQLIRQGKCDLVLMK